VCEDEIYEVLHPHCDEPNEGHFVAKRLLKFACRVLLTQLFIKMLWNMSTNVMNANEWVDLLMLMRYLCNTKLPWKHLINGAWISLIQLILLPIGNTLSCLGFTNYLTKWVEVKAMFNAKEDKVVKFLYGNIFTVFSVP
jgi:hypothetical protein